MRSLSEVKDHRDPLIDMMNERSGFWDINPERVALISRYKDLLSERNKEVAVEMLQVASKGNKLWNCTGEFFALLVEIKRLHAAPTEVEMRNVLKMVIEGSKRDKIDHREWVKGAVSLLSKMTTP